LRFLAQGRHGKGAGQRVNGANQALADFLCCT